MLDPLMTTARITPAERAVLAELVQGATNDEIGARLYNAPGTVKTHVTRLLRKFAVATRDVLIARFWANGCGWYWVETWISLPVLPAAFVAQPGQPRREGEGDVIVRVHGSLHMHARSRVDSTNRMYIEVLSLCQRHG